jgi:LmbE family N-acetylglucosaminyl deacetylase
MKKLLVLFTLFYYPVFLRAQPTALSSSEIYHKIEKLSVVGNAMYVAAHPDDENTLLIAWLAKEKKLRTAYMALTRGDGGQNLIGPEQGEYVGLLRTHELLEARKIDGGEQFFSRAIDFGFSKKTEEALSTWGREEILKDLVYQIRKFKPDVIINRFPPDERAGHGHHSASAVLSAEAFDAAADPNVFPEQVVKWGTWQAKRLVWNSFNRGFTNAEPNEPSFFKVSIGDFNPILGKSYPEIASEARSKHRSQGFGSAPSRNERYDFMVNIKGKPAAQDLFEDIDLSWNRITDGKEISILLEEIRNEYDFKNPSKSVKKLLSVYKKIENLKENPYKENKLNECRDIILAVSGIYVEANSATNFVTPGEEAKIYFTSTKRSDLNVILKNIEVFGVNKKDTLLNKPIGLNKAFEGSFKIKIPENADISQPYWLWNQAYKGIFELKDEEKRGLPMSPDALHATFNLEIEGQQLNYSHPVKYKFTEPSRGEIYKYFEIRPKVTLNHEQKVYIFQNQSPKDISILVKAHAPKIKARVKILIDKKWKVNPEYIDVNLEEKNQEKLINFSVIPPNGDNTTEITAIAEVENSVIDRSLKSVIYEHIPEINIFPKATAKANKISLISKSKKIGYIAGAGDEVPDALKQIGYQVDMLGEDQIKGDLSIYESIVVGVRAYNTENWLPGLQPLLFEYVKKGGNMVVQYQTQAFYGTVKTKELGPFPLSVGRGRVTNEDAEMKILVPNSKILNFPNKITSKDFEGWVQERGLYFADKWSDKYQSIFSIKDLGETEQEGSLLIGNYGKGYYVFTGLSFFRQLPAGVPGAYRLMANILSLNKK